MSFYHRKELMNIQRAMRAYLDLREAKPYYVARDWTTLPHEIQEPFFDVCVSYIQEIAEMDDAYTPLMRINRDTARDMLGMESEVMPDSWA